MKVFIEPTHYLENILDFLAQLPKTDFEYHFIVDSDDHLQGYTYIEENTITVAVADEKDILTLAHECVHLLQHILDLEICETQAYALEQTAQNCLLGKLPVKSLIRKML